ncbi:Crp/Fnr family transcriptional regulator [Sediminibacterium sp. TEGAF015]|uniref:Crp/Fnr family transcriptional regulator n=1 Tax=Sediminibacterium sp. TEGAF015 TaxID=575378 RepID=UPI00220F9E91|nr:Crp/Fnr family transcriptional regulator [Sediminibacterium sp. TEGAF015]BDQ13200.1 cyclic nucleotide-binding protein [Sediminibacterium sp. TEGAF015]
MYEAFLAHFNKRVALTQEEEALVKTYLMPKKIRKKQYLLQEGDVCKSFAFIEKGALKAYTVDESGSESIIQFGIEGWIIADLFSFLTGEPATYNIDAVEDAELVLMSKTSHDSLLKILPKYETYTRLNFEGAYIAMQRRLTSIIGSTLEERYEQFTKQYPEIIQRFPQHMIAAYMGLTPETLSRIRRRISTK